jgi:threonyl-tRNA synthetase
MGYRVTLDDRNERLSKKIREAQMQKVKFQIVIGDEEVKNKTITYRKYNSKEQHTTALKSFKI